MSLVIEKVDRYGDALFGGEKRSVGAVVVESPGQVPLDVAPHHELVVETCQRGELAVGPRRESGPEIHPRTSDPVLIEQSADVHG